ncbi:carboxyl-terminal processing protease [Geminocystis sp. NIES-3708]|uniref:carboxyl-terminal processing protease CtpA n=1 Tax=Geminocystis sp. NIES-3708 TaxID=1615909 RepID=UPI0005FC6D61|nr:carboxyl-terminal processing protease CtpA [Geminocystis sp. NIES-3708]BAQ59908.1 carboxyl-terminal processing protease [Geminocystis sp. NIES-3708]
MKKICLNLAIILLIFCSNFIYTPKAYAYSEEEKILLQSWRLVNEAYVDESFNHQNWWQIRQNFLKKPLHNREETYTAIREMLALLDDPYTRLLPPENYHNLQITTSGELSGIGLQISINPENNQLEVVTPLPSSPAELAGIQPRDQIITIDGINTQTLTLDEAANKIRGEIGTTVAIEVKRQNDGKIKTYELKRDRLSLSAISSRLDNSQSNYPIGYLRLNQFSGNATKDLAHALVQLEREGAQGYILDLRNNPGGLLQAGIEIARLWLQPSTIVYTVNRQGVLGSYDSDGEALTDKPLVVLVNQGSASASEILAGALQDNHRGILIGEKTFGKGLIQSLFELPDGAGIAITVAKYETPSHKDINKLGITPDQIVTQDPISYFEIGTEKDIQYQTAISYLATAKNYNNSNM